MRALFLTVLLFSSLTRAAAPIRPARTDWLVFASSTCEECLWLKDQCLPELQMRLKRPLPRTLLFDFDVEGNYDVLVAVEDALKTTGDGVPILLAGTRLLYGKEAIAAWAKALQPDDLATPLPEAVMPCVDKGRPSLYLQGATPSPKPQPEATGAEGSLETALVLYFRTPGCPSCALTGTRLDHLAKQFPDVPIYRLSIDTPEARYLQYAVAKQLALPSGKRLVTPMVVSGTSAIYGKEISNDALTELLQQAKPDPFWRTWDQPAAIAAAKTELDKRMQSFTLPAILLGGLIDGVNPCAFAVITFLISYLSLSRAGGRRAALVFGLLFTLGVFICYFLIGLGLSELFNFLQAHRGIIRTVYGTMGGVCLVFAVLAVWDTRRAQQGDAMRFGMPKAVHKAAHSLIRRQVGRGVLGLGTVLLGMMVSALELVCTGQIYLPSLILMNQSGRNLRSLLLLIAYNVAFIVPLVLVVVLGVYGVGSKQLAAWGKRHAALTRALMALLFVGLAALLFVLAWQG
jgi:cytochrome c biogenesis protein CcdA